MVTGQANGECANRRDAFAGMEVLFKFDLRHILVVAHEAAVVAEMRLPPDCIGVRRKVKKG